MRISDWSSDVCSSDLARDAQSRKAGRRDHAGFLWLASMDRNPRRAHQNPAVGMTIHWASGEKPTSMTGMIGIRRSEEHTSELQSLMRISYADFCLKKKKKENKNTHIIYRKESY